MNKLFKSIIFLILSFSFTINSVFANENITTKSNNTEYSGLIIQETEDFQSFITSFITTNEPNMPNISSVSNSNYALNSEYSSWLNKVVKINEEHYGQKVVNIDDKSNKIVLYFETVDESNAQSYYDIETGKTVYIAVDRIEYDKTINNIVSLNSVENNNIRQSSTVYSSYKFTYYYAWDSGLYEDDRITGLLSSIGKKILDYALKTGDKTVDWIVENVLGPCFDEIDIDRSITAISMNTYYYYNKVCSINVSGMWIPNVWVGSRYIFSYYLVKAYYPSGQPYPEMNSEKKEANGNPPTNADNVQFKSHYNDNAWLKNKSSEMLQAGLTYTDIYGYAVTPDED